MSGRILLIASLASLVGTAFAAGPVFLGNSAARELGGVPVSGVAAYASSHGDTAGFERPSSEGAVLRADTGGNHQSEDLPSEESGRDQKVVVAERGEPQHVDPVRGRRSRRQLQSPLPGRPGTPEPQEPLPGHTGAPVMPSGSPVYGPARPPPQAAVSGHRGMERAHQGEPVPERLPEPDPVYYYPGPFSVPPPKGAPGTPPHPGAFAGVAHTGSSAYPVHVPSVPAQLAYGTGYFPRAVPSQPESAFPQQAVHPEARGSHSASERSQRAFQAEVVVRHHRRSDEDGRGDSPEEVPIRGLKTMAAGAALAFMGHPIIATLCGFIAAYRLLDSLEERSRKRIEADSRLKRRLMRERLRVLRETNREVVPVSAGPVVPVSEPPAVTIDAYPVYP